MTAYSAIANSEIAVGAPITNSLMTKVRDNPLAIQENDATAPTVALATNITSQGALATLNSVDSAQIDTDAVGHDELDTAIGSTGTQNVATSATWTPSAGWYNFLITTTGTGVIYTRLSTNLCRFFFNSALFYCDGSNMQFRENGTSAANIFWQKLG